MKYSKTKLKMHLKGIEMETYSSPFLRISIGISLMLVALGIAVFLGGEALAHLLGVFVK